MKKFLLQIIFLMLVLPGISQSFVYITGTVTDISNGNPIANHAVTISSDSSGGFIYYETVYTSQNGSYTDTVPVPSGDTGVLYVQTIDCQNYPHQTILFYYPGNLNFTADFLICNSNTPCQADFHYYTTGILTVQFLDYSTGTNGPWNWNFGDGSTSTQQNPSHLYSNPGQYYVSLAIGSPNTSCYDVKSLAIYLNDSTGGGCNAAFYAYPDSMNNPPNTYYFVDQSTGNIGTWLWDFGDGNYQTVTYPGNPNVTHTYQGNALVHIACLTIQGNDSTCFDQTCDTIYGSGTGCIANFLYSLNPNTYTPTLFSDASQTGGGSQITQWGWSFGDPGSGASNISNLQNPAHLFSGQGYFNVCLTIQNQDSSCFDMTCTTIYVSSANGCQADYSYYVDTTYASGPIHFLDQSFGNINSWTWDFGDGSPVSTDQNTVHVFPAPGSYTVCLTIHGVDSTCYDVACRTVNVGNYNGCQSLFTFAPGPAGTASSIQFTDLSTGNPTNWMWNFGDSTYSTEQNPVHVYPGPGTYLACLTITANNGANCTSTSCQTILVVDSVPGNQVYGQVIAGNYPVQQGLALIFSIDSTANYSPYIDVCSLDQAGFYHFNAVPEGNYLIYAIPLDSGGYMPTYYGNVLNWAEATVIALGEPNNPYNINLLPAGSMNGGPGSVGGQVNMGDLKSSMLDKMTMLLLNESSQAISFVRVSTSGSFDFPTLDYGTYYLYAELSGISSDYVKVVLTPETPHVDVVMTFEGKNVLGINNMNAGVEAGVIYPNPANDKINLVLNAGEANTVKADIFDMKGLLVSSTTRSTGPGQTVLTISVSDIAPGFYTLRISSVNGISISRKLLIAK